MNATPVASSPEMVPTGPWQELPPPLLVPALPAAAPPPAPMPAAPPGLAPLPLPELPPLAPTELPALPFGLPPTVVVAPAAPPLSAAVGGMPAVGPLPPLPPGAGPAAPSDPPLLEQAAKPQTSSAGKRERSERDRNMRALGSGAGARSPFPPAAEVGAIRRPEAPAYRRSRYEG